MTFPPRSRWSETFNLFCAGAFVLFGAYMITMLGSILLLTLIVRSMHDALSPILRTSLIFLPAFAAYALSGLYLLSMGPSEGRIRSGSLCWLTCWVSIFSGICLMTLVYGLNRDKTGWIVIASALGLLAITSAWCLTWSIDVVRRRKLSGPPNSP